MNHILNVIRAIAYIVASLISVGVVFLLFGILSTFALSGILNAYDYLNVFVFWILFILIGLGVVSFLWGLLETIAVLIIWLVSKICPYKQFGIWVMGVISGVCTISYIYNLWAANAIDSTSIIFLFIILSILALMLFVRIVQASTLIIKPK